MPWIRFTADYDHRWPSRAVTAYKAGMVLYVKGDVAKAAREKGKAEPARKPDEAGTDDGA